MWQKRGKDSCLVEEPVGLETGRVTEGGNPSVETVGVRLSPVGEKGDEGHRQ